VRMRLKDGEIASTGDSGFMAVRPFLGDRCEDTPGTTGGRVQGIEGQDQLHFYNGGS
jgi:hypothetical protein